MADVVVMPAMTSVVMLAAARAVGAATAVAGMAAAISLDTQPLRRDADERHDASMTHQCSPIMSRYEPLDASPTRPPPTLPTHHTPTNGHQPLNGSHH